MRDALKIAHTNGTSCSAYRLRKNIGYIIRTGTFFDVNLQKQVQNARICYLTPAIAEEGVVAGAATAGARVKTDWKCLLKQLEIDFASLTQAPATSSVMIWETCLDKYPQNSSDLS